MSNAKRTPGEIKPLLCGVVNVQVTPFKSMTEIDEVALRDNTRFMIENGIVEGRGVQIVALKECTGRTDKLREVAFHLADRLAILPCLTPRTMPFDYQLGAVGFVTWYANFNPAYALEIHDVCLAQDFARAQELYARSRPLSAFIEAAVRAGGLNREIALVKEMCRLSDRPMGEVERLPIVRPSEDERRELRRLMTEAGLL